MSEKWTLWKPIPNLEDKYFIESMCDMMDGFHIIFAPGERGSRAKKVKFFFEGSVTAFRITEEGCRVETIAYLDITYQENPYADWTFFKVENSSYLKWLSEQSSTISDHLNLQHICCITDDSFLDIATRYEPEISFIE